MTKALKELRKNYFQNSFRHGRNRMHAKIQCTSTM